MNNLTPQTVLFNTIRMLIGKLQSTMVELNEKHENLDKKIDHRSRKILGYMSEHELKYKELINDIDDLVKNVEKIKGKLIEVEDYIKEQKMQFGVAKKTVNFLKQAYVWVGLAITAIGGFITFYIKYLIP